jgi:hypothetical protein
VLHTGRVRIWLDLPDDVVERLHAEAQDLSGAALEALAIDAYWMNRITAHQCGAGCWAPVTIRVRRLSQASRRPA